MEHSPGNRIKFCEAIGFILIIALSWANELAGLSNRLLGGRITPNWREAVCETALTLLVGGAVVAMSSRMSRRLHHLEGYLRLCAWCRKIEVDGRWITIEQFVQKKLDQKTTHGICPSCQAEVTQHHHPDVKENDGCLGPTT